MLLQETFLNGLVDGRTSLFVITLPFLSKTKQNKTKKSYTKTSRKIKGLEIPIKGIGKKVGHPQRPLQRQI